MLNLEDNFEMYFIQQPVRVRQFEIGGIYESDVSELMIFCHWRHKTYSKT